MSDIQTRKLEPEERQIGYGRTLLEAIRRAVHIIPKNDESVCKL